MEKKEKTKVKLSTSSQLTLFLKYESQPSLHSGQVLHISSFSSSVGLSLAPASIPLEATNPFPPVASHCLKSSS